LFPVAKKTPSNKPIEGVSFFEIERRSYD